MKWFLKTNNRCIKTALVSFSTWIIAILINVILFAVVTSLQGSSGHFWQIIGLVLVTSALYSLPGIIIFWLVFLFNFYHRKIFKTLLITATVTSFLSVLCLLLLVGNGSIHFQSVPLFTMAILSAVIAVVLHRQAIADITYADTNEIELNKKTESLET
jgi:hypothetical protein